MSKVQTDRLRATRQVSQAVLKKKPQKESQKRLGTISKQAKEAKRLERELQAEAQMSADAEEDQSEKLAPYLVGGLAAVGVAYYLYLNKDKLISETKRLPTIPEEEEPPPKRKSKRIFDQ